MKSKIFNTDQIRAIQDGRMKPIKKYFRRYAGMWIWQICYSDQVNYAGCSNNLFRELFDYRATCRRARKEQEKINQ